MKMPPLPPRPDVRPLLGTVLSIPNTGFDKRWDQAIKNNTSYYKSLQRMTKEELIQHHIKSCIRSLMTGKPGFQRIKTSHTPVRVLASKRGVAKRVEKRDETKILFINFQTDYRAKYPKASTCQKIA